MYRLFILLAIVGSAQAKKSRSTSAIFAGCPFSDNETDDC